MDYQGNSKKSKDEKVQKEKKPEKVVEKVIKGEVINRPKPLGAKFKGVFFGGEIKDSVSFVIDAVLLPALRNLVVDAVSKGSERMVYGESSGRRRPSQPEYRPRVTYNNPISRTMMRDPRDPRESGIFPNLPDQRTVRRKDSNQIILANRDEAELVLERLIDIINQYEVASVADLYDLLGLTAEPTDNKWGWTSLNNVEIRQTREGYLLDLPPAETI